MMSFGMIGVSVHGGNLPLLEAFVIPESERATRLAHLKESCGFEELAPVYTCNRSEFYYVTKDCPAGIEYRNHLLDYFLAHGPKVAFEPSDLNSLVAFRALRHLYRVAASLDSLVVGEAQILGQVKQSLAEAQTMGLAGPRLSNLFADAFRVAKKVRRETPLGQYAVSMVTLVLESVAEHLRCNPRPRVAIVGVGPMSVKLAGALRERQEIELLFVNRTEEKAQELAATFGGASTSLASFLSGTTKADVIFTATGSADPVFAEHLVPDLVPESGELLLIDLALPRDVDPNVRNIRGVRLLDIGHFRGRAEQNRRVRFRAVDSAERIIDKAIARAHVLNAQREFQPVIAAALNEGLAFAEAGMKRLFETRLSHLDAHDRDAISQWVRQLVSHTNRLPMEALARQADFTREDCALLAGYDCVEDQSGQAPDPKHPAAGRCAKRESGVCLAHEDADLDAQ